MLKFNQITLIITLLILVVGCANQTGTQSFDKQIAIADQGQAFLVQADWAGYAGLIEESELDKFRSMIMPGIERIIMATPEDSINLFGKFYNSQEIQSKTPIEFFGVIMTLVSEVSPEIKDTFGKMQNSSLGGIAESDSVVHVVQKTFLNIGGREFNEMNIQSLVLVGSDWKMKLSPKIDGIATMLGQALIPR